jgi:putative hydrolase of the HAD superfamily
MGALELVGFDGDDTLWESESVFAITHDRFRALLADHAEQAEHDRRLLDVERANLELYGYGVKAFTLSMVETAIEVTGGTIEVADIKAILDAGKELLAHPVQLLPGAAEAVAAAAERHRVVLVTKGDLFHQESKVARSGLGELFSGVEVVAEKDAGTYTRILRRFGVDPAHFLMIGNAPASDIEPVLGLGGWAVHVPHELTWALERHDDEEELARHPRYRRVDGLSGVAAVLAEIGRDREAGFG